MWLCLANSQPLVHTQFAGTWARNLQACTRNHDPRKRRRRRPRPLTKSTCKQMMCALPAAGLVGWFPCGTSVTQHVAGSSFAFGVLLGCLATGQQPHEGFRKQWRPAYKPEEVSAGTDCAALGAIYHRCVHEDPNQRPAMSKVLELLQDIALQFQLDGFYARPPADDDIRGEAATMAVGPSAEVRCRTYRRFALRQLTLTCAGPSRARCV